MRLYRSIFAHRPWLSLLLVLAVASSCLAGCRRAPKPVPIGSPTTAATRAPVLLPTFVPTLPTVATLSPTDEPATLTPTSEPTPATPTPPPTLTPEPPTPEPTLAILSFTATIADIPAGKRLTFEWATTGATSCRIVSGSAQRFVPQWPVGANGTHTADVTDTYYPNPAMTLYASDGAGGEVSQSVTVDWPCKYSYFFSPAPTLCPAYEVTTTPAAEETFEHGRMIWLSEMRFPPVTAASQVLVLYDDGQWAQYDDTWAEGEPESDPAIVPPAGLLQPIRGFGKVWREQAGVRDKLGWATAAEVGYTASWQPQMRESLPSVMYVQLRDGRVVEYAGQGTGSWEVVGGG